MRFQEFSTILKEAKVGREYQHLEDLVVVDGSAGANEAADILDNIGTDASSVSVKWDGRIAIYWGRDENGEFVLVGKNGWGKNKSTSSDDLRNFIASSGKGEEWRMKLADDLGTVFSIMQRATPANIRGFYFGDLLYYPGDPYQQTKAGIEFTPNKVTYTIDPNSSLGKRIAQSKVGAVAHLYHDSFGSTAGEPVEDVQNLNSKDVVVLGPTYVPHQPKIDTSAVKEIRNLAAKYGSAIDSVLAPQPGLSDMKQILYTYVNAMSKSQQLGNLNKNFASWLSQSKVSPNKQAKIKQMLATNSNAFAAIFELITKIMQVKNNIIDQLDAAPADVKASTKGETGGEGYVDRASKTKLVPRHRWRPE